MNEDLIQALTCLIGSAIGLILVLCAFIGSKITINIIAFRDKREYMKIERELMKERTIKERLKNERN